MAELGAERYGGRVKRQDVGVNVVILVVGLAGAEVIRRSVPPEVLAMRAVMIYTAIAALGAGALALALLLTRHFPTVEPTTFRGTPAEWVRAWPGDWWYSVGLDVGLVVLGTFVVGLGLAVGAETAPLTVPGALLTAWFAVRVVLVLLGRRRDERLWLTDEHLVHDSARGRAVVRREVVRAVLPWSAGLIVEVDGEVRRSGPPWGWRPSGPAPADELRVDTMRMGPRSDDLASWLRSEVVTDPSGRAPAPGPSRRCRQDRSPRRHP